MIRPMREPIHIRRPLHVATLDDVRAYKWERK